MRLGYHTWSAEIDETEDVGRLKLEAMSLLGISASVQCILIELVHVVNRSSINNLSCEIINHLSHSTAQRGLACSQSHYPPSRHPAIPYVHVTPLVWNGMQIPRSLARFSQDGEPDHDGIQSHLPNNGKPTDLA